MFKTAVQRGRSQVRDAKKEPEPVTFADAGEAVKPAVPGGRIEYIAPAGPEPAETGPSPMAVRMRL